LPDLTPLRIDVAQGPRLKKDRISGFIMPSVIENCNEYDKQKAGYLGPAFFFRSVLISVSNLEYLAATGVSDFMQLVRHERTLL